ncbi:Dipeptide transport protein 2 (ABC superfamily, membrane) (plasmid) [Cupriavidus taiwanensis]|uniref:Dipeptide transport protein 2 (ABC superfamily, membrane) n=1 Tax=Cupriavidus taiwanensis TaxID=164546 RepID=A0A7Z7JED3_9BURK|nr:dipeptide transport protein 2 (ABC superfamily, membrane) [Cupriavidus taiwanensis]SOZ12916.1 dipeptide transport protein 2 (ABC superfamily, membrane) [Cupriavidus taiwanensis]SOZ41414.1 dipeptide transport protein 2 (ABC superfamily, membrane) [Cupriavidus taiwanensis]SPC23788.1 dipeptide transport protein 2 (ABC superfamily, membrane) [Cupriavidus taiwanensis]SPD54968.1 Dipeptide transport protein 2 (ABC superfamily, membrane) [Cupriavidus taiwanensis]
MSLSSSSLPAPLQPGHSDAPGAAAGVTVPLPPPASRRPLRRLLSSPSAVVGLALFATVLAAALSAGWIFPGDPLEMATEPLLWPGRDAAFPLGSDMLGRDILAGLFHGARASLLIAGVSTALAVVLGVAGGVTAGYFGGRADRLFGTLTTFFLTIPSFLFALAIVAVVQPSVWKIALAIGITSWPALGRLVRAEVLRLRHGDMVLASEAVGASHARIIIEDILPNTLTPVLVSASLMVATAILTESSLAFLGLADPNVASWGNMVGAGREVLRTDWYVCALPGLAIVLTVLALNLLGDGLATAFDPREGR